MSKAEKFKRFTETAAVEQDLRRSSVRAFFYSAGGGGVDFAIRIVSTAILARLISPEHFGLLTLVTAITAFADQFRDLGLSVATVQREKISYEEVTNLFWVNVGAGVLVASVIAVCAPAISLFYAEARLTPITIAIAFCFIWGGLTVQHESLLTRQMKLGEIAMIRLTSSLISTVLAVVLAMKGFGYWALVWREVSRSAFNAIGMWVLCPWLPGLPHRNVPIGSLLRFGGNLTASHILTNLVGSLDRILIGKFFGPAPAAMYRQAYQLVVTPMDQLIGPINNVAQPGLSMLQLKPERYRLFYQKIVSVVALGTMPLSLFMAVYAPEIVLLVLGAKWTAATLVFRILSIGAFIRAASGTVGSVLITTGRTREYFWVGVIQNAVLAVCMVIGIKWGASGVAWGQIFAGYLVLIPMLRYSFNDTPVSIGAFFSALYRPAAASLGMAAILLGAKFFLPVQGNLIVLVCGGVIAALIFPGIFAILPGGLKEIKEHLADLTNALRKKRAASS